MSDKKKFSFDFDTVIAQLQPIIHDAIKPVLEGAADDLNVYVVQIASDIANAGMVSDVVRRAALVHELEGQLKTVAEMNRLRINNAAWDSYIKTMNIIAKTLGAVASSAVAAAI